LAGQIAPAIDLILGTQIEDQRMGQGGGPLGPFGMPEGGRVAVNGIRGGTIFANQFLAIHGYNPHLLLGNYAPYWRIRRECHAHLIRERAFITGTVVVLHSKVIGLPCG
jgi:hypothetical protein